MKENQEDDVFFDDSCLIEDDYYSSIKELIKCKICKKILKEPMMCLGCQSAFCKNCTDNLNQENHSCENPKYQENKTAISLLKTLKYLCKNCKSEVKAGDIENHLEKGCQKNENPTKYINEIFRKQSLIRLNHDEIKKLSENKKKVNHITSKINIFIIFFFDLVILLGRSFVGKSSLINT